VFVIRPPPSTQFPLLDYDPLVSSHLSWEIPLQRRARKSRLSWHTTPCSENDQVGRAIYVITPEVRLSPIESNPPRGYCPECSALKRFLPGAFSPARNDAPCDSNLLAAGSGIYHMISLLLFDFRRRHRFISPPRRFPPGKRTA
jgi:hypothetical protein